LSDTLPLAEMRDSGYTLLPFMRVDLWELSNVCSDLWELSNFAVMSRASPLTMAEKGPTGAENTKCGGIRLKSNQRYAHSQKQEPKCDCFSCQFHCSHPKFMNMAVHSFFHY